LSANGTPRKGPDPRFFLVDLCFGFIEEEVTQRVQFRIQKFNALTHSIQQFEWADLLLRYQLG